MLRGKTSNSTDMKNPSYAKQLSTINKRVKLSLQGTYLYDYPMLFNQVSHALPERAEILFS